MPNKNRRNSTLKLSLSNIIKRLPLHQKLDDSQSEIIQFSSAWQQWALDNLPQHFERSAILSSFSNGSLTIRCNTPTAASQIKHLQVSLLTALHDAGFTHIERLKIQINHRHDFLETSQSEHVEKMTATEVRPPQNLANETLNGIKNCSNTVKSERLMGALQKLAATLEEVQGTENTTKKTNSEEN